MNPCAIGFFITPHGFGHAARAAALMQSLCKLNAALELHLFTQVPEHFFTESHISQFNYVDLKCDLGLVQISSLDADLSASATALNQFIPFDRGWVEHLAEEVVRRQLKVLICDIAPLGIAVAEKAGIPSILIENFTWDWIYQPLIRQEPRFEALCEKFDHIFTQATFRLQTQPICLPSSQALLSVEPVSRQIYQTREAVRQHWPLDKDKDTVFVTMGGVSENAPFIELLTQFDSVQFILTGVAESFCRGNVWAIANAQPIYTPDLINASDAMVAKTGYSTLSEAWATGIPVACVTRESFRESWILQQFVEQQLHGFSMNESRYRDGAWLYSEMPQLLGQKRREARANGADELARHCLAIIESS